MTSGVVDEKEGLYFAREGAAGEPPRPLHGPNQWPREQVCHCRTLPLSPPAREQVCAAPCHCPRRRANARTGGDNVVIYKLRQLVTKRKGVKELATHGSPLVGNAKQRQR